MGKLKIRTFKRWFQVVHNGYTVAQFLSRREAEDYVRQEGGADSIPSLGIGYETTYNRRSYGTMRRIKIYP